MTSVRRGGLLDRADIDISMIQKAVAPTARVLAAARQRGVRVIYLKTGFRPDLADLGSSALPTLRTAYGTYAFTSGNRSVRRMVEKAVF